MLSAKVVIAEPTDSISRSMHATWFGFGTVWRAAHQPTPTSAATSAATLEVISTEQTAGDTRQLSALTLSLSLSLSVHARYPLAPVLWLAVWRIAAHRFHEPAYCVMVE